MTTITEDYVSFETSKLLKEKGFEGDVNAYYHIWDNGHRVCPVQEFSHSEAPHLYIPAPTQSMTMKWLREVHNLFIEIKMSKNTFLWGYRVSISNGSTACLHANSFNEYEQACEAAIKYCLEYLI